jgi:predicted membrane-bound mannosyltransferase
MPTSGSGGAWSQLSESVLSIVLGLAALGAISIATIPRDRMKKTRARSSALEYMDPYASLWTLAAAGKTAELKEASRKMLRQSGLKLPREAVDVLLAISRMREG